MKVNKSSKTTEIVKEMLQLQHDKGHAVKQNYIKALQLYNKLLQDNCQYLLNLFLYNVTNTKKMTTTKTNTLGSYMKSFILLTLFMGLLFGTPVYDKIQLKCGSTSIEYTAFYVMSDDYKKEKALTSYYLMLNNKVHYYEKEYKFAQSKYLKLKSNNNDIFVSTGYTIEHFCMKKPSANIDRIYIFTNTRGGNASVAEMIVDINHKSQKYKIVYATEYSGTSKILSIHNKEVLIYWDYGSNDMSHSNPQRIFYIKYFDSEKGFYVNSYDYSQDELKKFYENAKFSTVRY